MVLTVGVEGPLLLLLLLLLLQDLRRVQRRGQHMGLGPASRGSSSDCGLMPSCPPPLGVCECVCLSAFLVDFIGKQDSK